MEIERNIREGILIQSIIDRRDKILSYNNSYPLYIVTFYDNFFLNGIIKPALFNEKSDKYEQALEIIFDKLTFMDKYKIIGKIANQYKVNRFKPIDKFVKLRNVIAHNINEISSYSIIDNRMEIVFGKERITWERYLEKVSEWANLSLELAEFAANLHVAIFGNRSSIFLPYCEMQGGYILSGQCYIYPNPDQNVSPFWLGDMLGIIKLAKEEREFQETINTHSNH